MYQSKLYTWIKENNLDKHWLQNNGRFPKYQIEKLLNDPIYKPDGTTMRIILSIVKRYKPTAKLSDFWEV